VGDAMPDFDDDHHGHDGHHGYHEDQGYYEDHGYHGHHGHYHGGADTDWWPLLPGMVVVLLLLAVLAHHQGYDRMLIEKWRAWSRPEQAERDAWQAAVQRYGRTAGEFAAFECDPRAVLARPALADVTRPPTARFVDEFASACALRLPRRRCGRGVHPGGRAGGACLVGRGRRGGPRRRRLFRAR
jgi:hypothetical protein